MKKKFFLFLALTNLIITTQTKTTTEGYKQKNSIKNLEVGLKPSTTPHPNTIQQPMPVPPPLHPLPPMIPS